MFKSKGTFKFINARHLGAAAIITSLLLVAPEVANAAGRTTIHRSPIVISSSISVGIHSSSLSRANALASARQYIESMPFSRSGLIKQLKYEGYSRKDSTYAVDHLHANWKTQAKLSALQYLDSMPFSRSGLIAQLQYEGFSYSQAAYGVRKAGL